MVTNVLQDVLQALSSTESAVVHAQLLALLVLELLQHVHRVLLASISTTPNASQLVQQLLSTESAPTFAQMASF